MLKVVVELDTVPTTDQPDVPVALCSIVYPLAPLEPVQVSWIEFHAVATDVRFVGAAGSGAGGSGDGMGGSSPAAIKEACALR